MYTGAFHYEGWKKAKQDPFVYEWIAKGI